MATSKSQGSSSNGRDSNGQRLGVKRYGGQFVNAGEIIVKQKGTKFLPGVNASRSSDDSIFARKAGIVTFEWAKKDKKMISIYPVEGKEHSGRVLSKTSIKANKDIAEAKAAAKKLKAAKPAAEKKAAAPKAAKPAAAAKKPAVKKADK